MTAPLSGYTVVDLSTGIAGNYCTKLLSDGGADVIKVEGQQGDPLRRWSASGAQMAADEDGALFQFLAGGKRSVIADPALLDRLFGSADAVVWSPESDVSPQDLHRRYPHLVVTAISPFGLDGPWYDRAAPSSPCRRGRAAQSVSVAAVRTGHRCMSEVRWGSG